MNVLCQKIVWVLLFSGSLPPGQLTVGGVFGSQKTCEDFYQLVAAHGGNWAHTCLKQNVDGP